jgi:hypothetical protein
MELLLAFVLLILGFSPVWFPPGAAVYLMANKKAMNGRILSLLVVIEIAAIAVAFLTVRWLSHTDWP